MLKVARVQSARSSLSIAKLSTSASIAADSALITRNHCIYELALCVWLTKGSLTEKGTLQRAWVMCVLHLD